MFRNSVKKNQHFLLREVAEPIKESYVAGDVECFRVVSCVPSSAGIPHPSNYRLRALLDAQVDLKKVPCEDMLTNVDDSIRSINQVKPE